MYGVRNMDKIIEEVKALSIEQGGMLLMVSSPIIILLGIGTGLSGYILLKLNKENKNEI